MMISFPNVRTLWYWTWTTWTEPATKVFSGVYAVRARPKYFSDTDWSCWLALHDPILHIMLPAHWGVRVLTLDTHLYKRTKWCPIYDEMQLQWHLFDMVPVYIDNVLKCQCSQTRARNVQAYITRDREVLFTKHDGTVRGQPTPQIGVALCNKLNKNTRKGQRRFNHNITGVSLDASHSTDKITDNTEQQ